MVGDARLEDVIAFGKSEELGPVPIRRRHGLSCDGERRDSARIGYGSGKRDARALDGFPVRVRRDGYRRGGGVENDGR